MRHEARVGVEVVVPCRDELEPGTTCEHTHDSLRSTRHALVVVVLVHARARARVHDLHVAVGRKRPQRERVVGVERVGAVLPRQCRLEAAIVRRCDGGVSRCPDAEPASRPHWPHALRARSAACPGWSGLAVYEISTSHTQLCRLTVRRVRVRARLEKAVVGEAVGDAASLGHRKVLRDRVEEALRRRGRQ